ncbi:hypothetical protein DPMN_066567 [Dreissena polymorpha]|uniref:Uncharacterized protein n=1 Tax=Dreissena polymorpha TaxID=45954 RepID=A0A9D3YY48_DREPO|nr:hypothetical protein DPMN_066567 [Dreissena polymorpha]
MEVKVKSEGEVSQPSALGFHVLPVRLAEAVVAASPEGEIIFISDSEEMEVGAHFKANHQQEMAEKTGIARPIDEVAEPVKAMSL